MASKLIAEISRSDLWEQRASDATISQPRDLASYSWLEAATPTISVPGFPPIWSPPSPPPKLEPDAGRVYIDENAARNPDYPLESLFRALHILKPDFELRAIDIVTDRNNIRKLLKFVKGSSDEGFNIQVEIVNDKTALFTRMEATSTEIIKKFQGYGRNFEKTYTKRQPGAHSYHRILSYDFDGLKMLVRHETDGCINEEMYPSAKKAAVASVDDVSNVLGSLAISNFSAKLGKSSSMAVEAEGRLIPLSSTLEIKTRMAGRTLFMFEILTQLWISQTPRLVAGYWKAGVFNDIQVKDMKQEIRSWESENQTMLRNLASLIRKIVAAVKSSGYFTAIVKFDGGYKLKIMNGAPKRSLPDDLYPLWTVSNIQVGVPTVSKDELKEQKTASSTDARDRATITVPEHTPYADVISLALRDGFRHIFRRLPMQLQEYHKVCESLKGMSASILDGRGIGDIMNDFRKSKGDFDFDGEEISGNKSLARDSAFQLLYMFILKEFRPDMQERNAAYNATLFVVSHPRIFGRRTRKMVRAAFGEAFGVTDKQQKTLAKWFTGTDQDDLSDDDTTSEEYVFYGSDSDWD